MSASCSADSYNFSSGKRLCVSSEVIDAKKHMGSFNDYRRLVVNVGGMPTDVALSHTTDSSVSRSLLLAIEDASDAEFNLDYYSDLFNRAIGTKSVNFIEKYGLYKLDHKMESALTSYDYLKVNPSDLSAQPENLSDWYLGVCVEGIGRPDSCEIKYLYKGFLLKYSVIDTALSSWESITQKINSSVDSWYCD